MLEWNSEHRRYEMTIAGFKVHSVFQSISDDSQTVFGYEALCRIEKQGEKVNIKRFFKILEGFGEKSEFGFKFFLNIMHLRNFRQSSIYDRDTKLFLNVTPCFFKYFSHEHDLNNLYLPLIEEEQIDLNQIVVEIVEDYCPLADIESLHKGTEYLKSIGISFALDDFGTGWSGYSRMTIVQPNYIKVSREMLIEFGMSESIENNLLEELNTITSLKGIKVIFEGIENVENYQTADRYGADYYQGYYLDLPKSYPVNMPKPSETKPDETFRQNAHLIKKIRARALNS
ncbi:EAL domain-containing protein [Vibrio splendidus]|uniref:Diguanylate phosphodiesterase n=1 Tax=Vibrio splendidus 12E03 TaxID=1191305 RepID=A0A1E5FUA0_VIBSP|nr:EAL domain-containing protein [Vibrio splendidus]OEF94101.1 diguanylate phosphodiesterase [Vibrio splendidus 12E03]